MLMRRAEDAPSHVGKNYRPDGKQDVNFGLQNAKTGRLCRVR
jgi:hypothetical protein